MMYILCNGNGRTKTLRNLKDCYPTIPNGSNPFLTIPFINYQLHYPIPLNKVEMRV